MLSNPAEGSVAGADPAAPEDCWRVRGEIHAGYDVHAARHACCLHKLTARTAGHIRLHSVCRCSNAVKIVKQRAQNMHTGWDTWRRHVLATSLLTCARLCCLSGGSATRTDSNGYA